MANRWKIFFFDGNRANGIIVEERKDWVMRVVRGYHDYSIAGLLKVKSSGVLAGSYPSFGFYSEHQKYPTLGGWAKKQGMNLEVGIAIAIIGVAGTGRTKIANLLKGEFESHGYSVEIIEFNGKMDPLLESRADAIIVLDAEGALHEIERDVPHLSIIEVKKKGQESLRHSPFTIITKRSKATNLVEQVQEYPPALVTQTKAVCERLHRKLRFYLGR